ncbi:hypothetical protein EON71_00405 [bacterium]|nr:MAG: hypothetical protein EON71_00405 [bacterium]
MDTKQLIKNTYKQYIEGGGLGIKNVRKCLRIFDGKTLVYCSEDLKKIQDDQNNIAEEDFGQQIYFLIYMSLNSLSLITDALYHNITRKTDIKWATKYAKFVDEFRCIAKLEQPKQFPPIYYSSTVKEGILLVDIQENLVDSKKMLLKTKNICDIPVVVIETNRECTYTKKSIKPLVICIQHHEDERISIFEIYLDVHYVPIQMGLVSMLSDYKIKSDDIFNIFNKNGKDNECYQVMTYNNRIFEMSKTHPNYPKDNDIHGFLNHDIIARLIPNFLGVENNSIEDASAFESWFHNSRSDIIQTFEKISKDVLISTIKPLHETVKILHEGQFLMKSDMRYEMVDKVNDNHVISMIYLGASMAKDFWGDGETNLINFFSPIMISCLFSHLCIPSTYSILLENYVFVKDLVDKNFLITNQNKHVYYYCIDIERNTAKFIQQEDSTNNSNMNFSQKKNNIYKMPIHAAIENVQRIHQLSNIRSIELWTFVRIGFFSYIQMRTENKITPFEFNEDIFWQKAGYDEDTLQYVKKFLVFLNSNDFFC